MDKLEAMAVFVEVVDRGTLSSAAKRLKMPLATLSRKLSDLEDHLGTRLLVRTTRRLELTDAGANYLDASRAILNQVGEADRAAAGEYLKPTGELVLSVPTAFGRLYVLPIVNDYLARYPDVTIRLQMSDQRTDLVAERIDVAVRIGALPDSNLTAIQVGSLRWVVVACPSFLQTHGTPQSPDDLTGLPCVALDKDKLTTEWRFRDPESGVTEPVPIHSRLTSTTAEAAADAAMAGVGVTRVMHYQVAAAIEAGQLRVILSDYEIDPVPVSIVYPERHLLPLKTRSFLDFAAPRLKKSIPIKDVPPKAHSSTAREYAS
jgi:DNA-binding transcriptional LysR family regulator